MEERQAYLQLHACVILWGFTAILGRLISLPAVQLVCWRMALVAVVLLAVRRTWIGVAGMPRRSVFVFVAIGLIVAAHWVAFYTVHQNLKCIGCCSLPGFRLYIRSDH